MKMQIKIEFSANLPLDNDNKNLSVFDVAEALESGGIDSTFFGSLENRSATVSVSAIRGDYTIDDAQNQTATITLTGDKAGPRVRNSIAQAYMKAGITE